MFLCHTSAFCMTLLKYFTEDTFLYSVNEYFRTSIINQFLSSIFLNNDINKYLFSIILKIIYYFPYNFRKTPDILEKQPPPSSKPFRGKPWKQILAALVANLGTVTTGLVFGFSAVAIPQLEAEDSPIQVDKTQISWIGKNFILFRRNL